MPGSTPGIDLRAPALRLADYEDEGSITLSDRRPARASHERPALRLVEDRPPILIAGRDTPRRAALLADLADALPGATSFEEIGTLGEVLQHAPASRMVIVDGGLEDVSARSLMRILAQRHPSLPVIGLDPAGPDDL
jgi:hypothetical protein